MADPATTRPNIAERAAEHAERSPESVAFRFLGRHARDTRDLCWGELDRLARKVAACISNRGIVGRPVAIVCPDPKDFVVALCGCLYGGAIAVPVPAVATRRSAERIKSIIRAADPSALLASQATLAQAWLADLLATSSIEPIDLHAISESAGNRIGASSDRSPALMQFTSGSTGSPRGVVLSHGNIAANCAAIVETYGLVAGSCGVSWLPLHHDMGLIGHVLTPLWIGGKSCILDPLLFLQSPLRWLRQVTAERASITSAPNFAYELCTKAAAEADTSDIDLSSLTTAVCGGETVWPETMEGFCNAFSARGFKRSVFSPSYGLAEATLLVSSGKRAGGPGIFSGTVFELGADGEQTPVAVRALSLGRPVRGTTVRIVDSQGNSCPEGLVGEIEISGDSIGRIADDDARNGPASVLSGDLGFMNDGEIYVTGRRKELIILRGQNVYPADIENAAIRADPTITAGAVVAASLQQDGTEAMLVVFEVERRLVSSEQGARLCARVNEAVSRATGHMPRHTIAVPVGTLPRTTSGKIRRSAVGELYLSGKLTTVAAGAPQPAGAGLRSS